MVLGNSDSGSDLGEKALSKVVEVGLASQLDEVGDIEVDIRTDPGKLVQGKLDSINISAKGLVIKQDLRLETLEVSTDEVAINPLSAIFGNIELNHSTDAEARIVLTEADINRAFSSDFIQEKLQGLTMSMEGHPVTVDIQKATIMLPGENKFVISADFLLKEQGEVKKLSATAIPQIQENGQQISLEILAAEGKGLTLELVLAIFKQLTASLDLRNLDIPGMSFQVRQLDAQEGRLVIDAMTQIEQVPSA
ncbi:MAG: DUF2993 domain-containing protein [Timaviella obliquedivisa GSE-PSE-MK23-08B]|jgi:hypothetical protein|nr:DUF2993 domain-containing protein [Timaviella obliquedivisa GSE-PSE-MK23-08B]